MSSHERTEKIKNILWIILAANLGVAAFKLVLGYFMNSTSVTADGFHSLTDGISNMIGITGIYLASKPVDAKHPYGHKKVENIAGLFISFMLAFIAFKIISSACSRLFDPILPEINLLSFLIMLGTLMINIGIAAYEYKQGQKLNSMILKADSYHTRSDVYITIGIIITLAAMKLGLPPIIDPIVSLIVGLLIIKTALEIFKTTSETLMDARVIHQTVIMKIIQKFPEVKNAHNIRSRGLKDDCYIDLHIMVDPLMSVQEAHLLTHRIANAINEELGPNHHVIIHVEPYFDDKKLSTISKKNSF